ncbi:MAG: alpha-amylase family protein [Arachnia sp.]
MSLRLDHVVAWHVYPLGSTGAPIRGEALDIPVTHRLPKLCDWLDYVVELGCSVVQLGPIFESTSHGYDTLDLFRIDRRLGDDADFEALVAACHDRGLRLFLDGVFNHVGEHHRLLRRALDEGPDGELAGMFRIDWAAQPPRAEGWEGHGQLAQLNHDDPRVAEMIIEAMCHWLGKGADGWRLDAAYSVPSEFWQSVTSRVRERFEYATFVGEVIHGDYRGFVADTGVDSLTQYELWKAIWSSLTDANFFELAHALERHDDFCRAFTPWTFIGNHDVTRIATAVGSDQAVLAAAALFTLPGAPAVYYGDEQGFTGEKQEHAAGDDAVRPALPATPDELAGLGAWMYAEYQRLIGLRRRHPWLQHARVIVEDTANEHITWLCQGNPGEAIHVSLSVAGAPHVHIRSADEVLYEFVAR